MNLKKVILFVFIITTLLYISSLIVNPIQGQVIGGPGMGCQVEEITTLWTSLFVMSPGDITILKDNEDDCKSFVAYKSVNAEGPLSVAFIYASLATAPPGKKNLWKLKGFEGKYTATVRNDIIADYFEATEEQASNFNSLQEFEEVRDFLLSFSKGQGKDYLLWTIGSVEEAMSTFQSFFIKEQPTELTFFEKYYSYSDLNVVSSPTNESVNATYEEFYIFSDKISLGVRTVIGNYIRVKEFPFTKNISDYKFLKGSTNNFAFDLKEHVQDYAQAKNFGLLFRDAQNAKGQKVNYTIKGSKVYFTPEKTFEGIVRFIAYSVDGSGSRKYSNQFKVTITQTPNEAPTLTKPIANIYIPKSGTTKLPLKAHFSDPEGKKLTYRSSGTTTATISFVGDIAILTTSKPLPPQERAQIHASDGTSETASNTFSIFYDSPKQTNDSNEKPTNFNTKGNIPKNDTTKEKNTVFGTLFKNSFWITLLLIIMIISFIGFLLWLYLRWQKQKTEQTKKVNASSKNQVNDYLNQLQQQTKTE